MKYLKDMWLDHEERVIEALLEGLTILKTEERLARLKEVIESAENENIADNRAIEDKINRELVFCLLRANAQLLRNGRGIHSDPQYEQRGQPDEKYLKPLPNEYKRVDIRWGYFDPLRAMYTEQQGEKYFGIECKRLGSKIPSGKLNPKYVQNGIIRFVADSHRYGQHTSSGAMIGYIEDMAEDEILQEINDAIKKVKSDLAPQTKIAPLSPPPNGWQDEMPNCLNHQLERPFPKSPFTLWHFWLDLRNRYPRTRKKN